MAVEPYQRERICGLRARPLRLVQDRRRGQIISKHSSFQASGSTPLPVSDAGKHFIGHVDCMSPLTPCKDIPSSWRRRFSAPVNLKLCLCAAHRRPADSRRQFTSPRPFISLVPALCCSRPVPRHSVPSLGLNIILSRSDTRHWRKFQRLLAQRAPTTTAGQRFGEQNSHGFAVSPFGWPKSHRLGAVGRWDSRETSCSKAPLLFRTPCGMPSACFVSFPSRVFFTKPWDEWRCRC